MPKIIPSYAYSLDVNGNVVVLEKLKQKFLEHGGKLLSETERSFEFIISSNSLALSTHVLENDLKIAGQLSGEKIVITVTRDAAKRYYAYSLIFCFLLGIAIFLRDRDLKTFLILGCSYLGFYIWSFIFIHPAHAKIRNIVRFIN